MNNKLRWILTEFEIFLKMAQSNLKLKSPK